MMIVVMLTLGLISGPGVAQAALADSKGAPVKVSQVMLGPDGNTSITGTTKVLCSPDGKRVFVYQTSTHDSRASTSSVYVVDVEHGSVIADIPFTNLSPGNMELSPDGRTLYVLDQASIHVVDAVRGVETGTLGGQVGAFAVSHDGKTIYALICVKGGTLQEAQWALASIDTVSGAETVLHDIADMGRGMGTWRLSSDDTRMYGHFYSKESGVPVLASIDIATGRTKVIARTGVEELNTVKAEDAPVMAYNAGGDVGVLNIDTGRRRVIHVSDKGQRPMLSNDGKRLLIRTATRSSGDRDEYVVIDLAHDDDRTVVKAPQEFTPLLLDGPTGMLYGTMDLFNATGPQQSVMRRIDIRTSDIRESAPFAAGYTYAMTQTADGRRAFILAQSPMSLLILDTDSAATGEHGTAAEDGERRDAAHRERGWTKNRMAVVVAAVVVIVVVVAAIVGAGAAARRGRVATRRRDGR